MLLVQLVGMSADVEVTQTLFAVVGSVYADENVPPLILIYFKDVQPEKIAVSMLVTP